MKVDNPVEIIKEIKLKIDRLTSFDLEIVNSYLLRAMRRAVIKELVDQQEMLSLLKEKNVKSQSK